MESETPTYKKRVAIMQPYFLPYIGYFQLINAVDTFVLYDNIKYTKKGWINRNRMLLNNSDEVFSLPLRHDSDLLHVRDRFLAVTFDRTRMLSQISAAYRRAPFYEHTMAAVEKIILNTQDNLFDFLHTSLVLMCTHMGISTPIITSSTLDIDHDKRAEEKVLSICTHLGADIYINPEGGVSLYSKSSFAENQITLKFLKSNPIVYDQFGGPFIPWLSILDVLMFNSIETIRDVFLCNFSFIEV